jgi:hypothetical protein
MQWLVERLFGHEQVSESLWDVVYGLIGGGALLVLCAAYGAWQWDTSYWYMYLGCAVLGVGSISAGLLMIENDQVVIPANPPYKAILSIWGKRLRVLIPEKKAMRFPRWPLNIDYVLVPFKRENFDFEFESIVCSSTTDEGADGTKRAVAGGSVSVKVSLTIGPDGDSAESVIKFLNNGGIDGIRTILKDQVSQSVREIASRYDWETFTFMKDPLTVMLLIRIADIDLHQLSRTAEGLILPEMFRLKKDEYRDEGRFPRIEDPVDYLFPNYSPEKSAAQKTVDEKRIDQEIQVFLKIAREACFADVLDLGIEIFRINVTHIEASAALKAAADAVAREVKERDSEGRDTKTNVELANMYVAASGGSMTFEKALEQVQIDKQRITKNVHDIQGLERLLGGKS